MARVRLHAGHTSRESLATTTMSTPHAEHVSPPAASTRGGSRPYSSSRARATPPAPSLPTPPGCTPRFLPPALGADWAWGGWLGFAAWAAWRAASRAAPPSNSRWKRATSRLPAPTLHAAVGGGTLAGSRRCRRSWASSSSSAARRRCHGCPHPASSASTSARRARNPASCRSRSRATTSPTRCTASSIPFGGGGTVPPPAPHQVNTPRRFSPPARWATTVSPK